MIDQQAIRVRSLSKDDEHAWRALWAQYLAFYDTTVGEPVYASTFARLLGDDPQDYSCLVAEVDGELVGLAHFLFHRHGWRIDNVCYLQDLFAAPNQRGQGIGRKLIEAVYAAADTAGAPAVYWMTNADNTAARQLYDRIGTKTDFIKYQRP